MNSGDYQRLEGSFILDRVSIQRGVNGVSRQVSPLSDDQITTRFENSLYPISGFPVDSLGPRIDLPDTEQAEVLKKTVHVIRTDENVVRFGDAFYIVRKADGKERVLCRIMSVS